ncbi:hypothetical protein ONZ51_g10316 [Trametes cubensis]|uniref:Uncharacterized protein n=1 Tax=Trametes cubensis TaxID=1111947 RepID=A0AAD7X902_9APHY|nr:hypothetical protein ONZ51_g10316 [Trametes cubensis]
MGIFEIFERAVEDTANISTTSGVSGLGLFGVVLKQLPGSSIERGHKNLRDGFSALEDSWETIPQNELRSFYHEYDRLLDIGLRLQEEWEQLKGSFCTLKLSKRSWAYEEDSYAFHYKVQLSSDSHRAQRRRPYTPCQIPAFASRLIYSLILVFALQPFIQLAMNMNV